MSGRFGNPAVADAFSGWEDGMEKVRRMKKNGEFSDPADGKMPLAVGNYKLLLLGAAAILLGLVLMSGGGSDSPDEFDYAMFSWRRITLAPLLVIGGFVFEIYAILKRR